MPNDNLNLVLQMCISGIGVASQCIVLAAAQCDRQKGGGVRSASAVRYRTDLGIQCGPSSLHPHNSSPRPANAAALLRQEDAATSAAGALDADSRGSDATAE